MGDWGRGSVGARDALDAGTLWTRGRSGRWGRGDGFGAGEAGGSFCEASFPLHLGSHTAMRSLLPALRRDFPGMCCPILMVCPPFPAMRLRVPMGRPIGGNRRSTDRMIPCIDGEHLRIGSTISGRAREEPVEPRSLVWGVSTEVCRGSRSGPNRGSRRKQTGAVGRQGATPVRADDTGPVESLPLSFPAAPTVSEFSSAHGVGL